MKRKHKFVYGNGSKADRLQAQKELMALPEGDTPEHFFAFMKWELKWNVHPDKNLQADYNKYGPDAFEIKLLPQFDTIEEALAANPNAIRINEGQKYF